MFSNLFWTKSCAAEKGLCLLGCSIIKIQELIPLFFSVVINCSSKTIFFELSSQWPFYLYSCWMENKTLLANKFGGISISFDVSSGYFSSCLGTNYRYSGVVFSIWIMRSYSLQTSYELLTAFFLRDKHSIRDCIYFSFPLDNDSHWIVVLVLLGSSWILAFFDLKPLADGRVGRW